MNPPCWICGEPNDRAMWDAPSEAEACQECEMDWLGYVHALRSVLSSTTDAQEDK